MAGEDATLRDALSEGTGTETTSTATTTATGTTDSTSTSSTTTAATTQAVANADAAEIGQILLDSGFSKAQLNELMQAPNALKAINGLIRTNPAEFLSMLERTEPDAAKNFHESMANIYVERYADKGTPGDKGKGDGSPELLNEIRLLREKTNQLETREQQRQNAAAMSQMSARYDGRVNELMESVKDLGLNKSEMKNLRARLNTELAADPAAVQRASNGNFVDVPRVFKSIIDEYTGEKKAAVDAEKAKREEATKRAKHDFSSGPGQLIVDMPKGFEDSWEGTEDALAAALQKVSA